LKKKKENATEKRKENINPDEGMRRRKEGWREKTTQVMEGRGRWREDTDKKMKTKRKNNWGDGRRRRKENMEDWKYKTTQVMEEEWKKLHQVRKQKTSQKTTARKKKLFWWKGKKMTWIKNNLCNGRKRR
jgi:hypothetical protein